MLPEINLLPKELGEKNKSRTAMLLLLLATVLVIAALGLVYWFMSSSLDKLQSAESDLQSEVAALEQSIAEKEEALKNYRFEAIQVLEGVLYPVTPLITEAHRMLPYNGFVDTFSWSERSIQLTTQLDNKTDVAEFVRRLKASPFFSDVTLASITAAEAPGRISDDPEFVDFSQVPRAVAVFTLEIDPNYLVESGGAQ